LITKKIELSNFNLKKCEYKQRILTFLDLLPQQDFFLFLGPSISGKSSCISDTFEIQNQLHIEYPDDHFSVSNIKVFPKAYDKHFLFSEVEKHSNLQFYSKIFKNKNLYRKWDIFISLEFREKFEFFYSKYLKIGF